MFTDNRDFYPTPKSLFIRMWAKLPREVKQHETYFLDPEAGQGHIVEYIRDQFRWGQPTIHAIEKDERFVATLKGKNIPVIDRDFLTYCGPDKYDVIIANPPFSSGEHHLLKMIEIMYSGHIVCLLNAETIRKPNTNARKSLLRKLAVLKADVEYHSHCFVEAERKTDVRIALIHIHIDRKVEEDLFEGLTEATEPELASIDEAKELVEKDSIRNLVADYNRTVEIGTKALLDHFKYYRHISPYLKITVVDGGDVNDQNLTQLMKTSLNQFLAKVRRVYWGRLLEFNKVASRMTSKRSKEFHTILQRNQMIDFTETNIRAFIVNTMKDYDSVLTDATLDIFDKLTHEYAYDDSIKNGNVHYFNGWKTNKAWFCNQKVIIPFWGEAFWDKDFSKWKVGFNPREILNDIDKVMNSFDGAPEYTSIVDALDKGFARDQTRRIKSTYFEITVFKKGTIHLTFLDPDILRRFNITACRGKNWLPMDYGHKKYEAMTSEEQAVVNEFEGRESYTAKVSSSPRLFASKATIQIEYEPEAKAA